LASVDQIWRQPRVRVMKASQIALTGASAVVDVTPSPNGRKRRVLEVLRDINRHLRALKKPQRGDITLRLWWVGTVVSLKAASPRKTRSEN